MTAGDKPNTFPLFVRGQGPPLQLHLMGEKSCSILMLRGAPRAEHGIYPAFRIILILLILSNSACSLPLNLVNLVNPVKNQWLAA
jgi:hypothetical protein